MQTNSDENTQLLLASFLDSVNIAKGATKLGI